MYENILFYLFLSIPCMVMAQLNENVLAKDFELLENKDFRKVTHEDTDNWAIEYLSDYYYEPKTLPPYTFLEFPISSASVYLNESRKIKCLGLRITTEDINGFLKKMISVYGNPTIVNPSGNYFEKKGIQIPKEYNNEAVEIIQSIPIPDINDYEDMSKIAWYDVIAAYSSKKIQINLYNHSEDKLNIYSASRTLRIIFKFEEED